MAQAQLASKIARVGWLSASIDNPVQAMGHQILLSAFRRLGFTEGHNLILEHRPIRILRGAKPAELPVQLPTKYEMAVNLKTAKALGLAVPLSIWLRTDEVIE
jgi:hypothetical protein